MELCESAMRIAISVDMEGISGTVSFKQIVASNPEFQRAQRLATGDVNAAIAGAREAGATRFFIHDTHWLDEINVLVDELDGDVEYVGGQPLLLWEGLSADYDAAFLIGYHARSGQPAIMSHVFTDLVCDVRLNGRPAGEGALAAALAGYYGIPTVLVTGDDWVAAEMRAWCPAIETAQTKVSITRYAARCLPLDEARFNIREAACRAMSGLAAHKPLRIEPPISLDVRWRNTQTARSVALMPGIEIVEAETTRFVGADYAQVDRALKAMLHIALSPLNAGHVQMP
jgi:D-amino peptidase